MQHRVTEALATGTSFTPEGTTEDHHILGFLTSGHGVWLMYTHSTDAHGVSLVHEWRMCEPSPWMVHERSHPKTLLDIVNTAFNSLAAQR